MKLTILLLSLLLLICSCEKVEILKTDWKCTEYKAVFKRSFPNELSGSSLRFYKVNDSILYLYNNNYFGEDDIFYNISIKNGNLKIADCRPQITGHIMDLSFTDQKVGFLLVFDTDIDKKGLLYTHDGGITWEKITSIPNFRRIHFSGSNTGIASTSNKIYKTFDAGYTWEEIHTSFYHDGTELSPFYLIPEKPEIVFISDYEYLYYSINGGFDWTTHSQHKLTIRSLSLINVNMGYIIDEFKDIYKIDAKNGSYNLIYNGDNYLSNIKARSDKEVYFRKDLKICRTTDGFKSTREMTIEDPFPDLKSDGFVADYYFLNETGVLVDTKGTFYLYNE
jgi:hypothetical protein